MQVSTLYLSTLIPQLVELGLNVLIAALILAAGWWLSTLSVRMVRRAAAGSDRIDPTVVPMIASMAAWAVRVLTLIAVLARFGVQTASLIAVLGAAGLAIGLALQGTLQNIAAGIMLIALRPLRAGEYIAVVGGPEGSVEEIGLFLTRLTQGDGVCVSVPNSSLWNASLVNYSRNPRRRFDLQVTVRHGDDVELAQQKLRELVAEYPQALTDPAPRVMVTEYRDNGVVVNLRVWAANADYWDLRFDLYRRARAVLESAGLRPAVPVREIQGQAVKGHPAKPVASGARIK